MSSMLRSLARNVAREQGYVRPVHWKRNAWKRKYFQHMAAEKKKKEKGVLERLGSVIDKIGLGSKKYMHRKILEK